jgi:hypothetical protein
MTRLAGLERSPPGPQFTRYQESTPKILINATLWRPVGGARILVPAGQHRLFDVVKLNRMLRMIWLIWSALQTMWPVDLRLFILINNSHR